MAARRSAAVVAAAYISILLFAQFSSTRLAGAAPKQHTSTPPTTLENEIGDLQNSLKAEKQKVDELVSAMQKLNTEYQGLPKISEEQKAYLGGVDALRQKFESLQSRMEKTADKMEETAEHVSSKEMDITNSYFNMLSLVLIGASVVVAIAGVLAFPILENSVTKHIARRVEKEIKERALFETSLGRADTFSVLAFAWYEHYAKEFQTSLKSNTPPTMLKESDLGRLFSRRGMSTLDQPEFAALSKSDPRVWTARATLMNLFVYNTTVHYLCKTAAGDVLTDDEIATLLASAETCLSLAKDLRAHDRHWYDLFQTAAFAMIKLGDPRTQRRGRSLMLGLLAGDRPGSGFKTPGLVWRQDLWDDCFATGQLPSDLLELGHIPVRP